jgi:hypothetical protein
MKTLTDEPEKKKGFNILFVVAILVGIGLVAGLLGLVSLKKSSQQIQVDAMEGAFREGSPEFEKYTKKIIAETDVDNTQQSPTGLGTIVMSIRGNILNITGKTLTGLEIRVSVVDSDHKPVKEKIAIVIPKEVEKLETGKSLPVQVVIEGFNKDDDRANIRWKVTAIKVQE